MVKMDHSFQVVLIFLLQLLLNLSLAVDESYYSSIYSSTYESRVDARDEKSLFLSLKVGGEYVFAAA